MKHVEEIYVIFFDIITKISLDYFALQHVLTTVVVMVAVWLAWQRWMAPCCDRGRHSNNEFSRYRKRSASEKHPF